MSFLNTELPIVAAPMAGGPSTVALAKAVAGAGGFPFLAGGYKTVETLAQEIDDLRESTETFGVNLFAPNPQPVDREAFKTYAKELAKDAAAYDIELDLQPRSDDDRWAEKLAYLTEHPVPLASFTFGLPQKSEVQQLQGAGTTVLASVTNVPEAQAAEALGVDGLVVQGPRAGGHSATHDPARSIEDIATAELVKRVREVSQLPLVAAGGVDGPGMVKELLDAGADAVAVGTLLLRTEEAGTSATHRAGLANADYTETILTPAFTGRQARALLNDFARRHHEHAINAYPAVHFLTSAFRKAAGAAGDQSRLHMWAGTGWKNAREESAAETVRRLAADL